MAQKIYLHKIKSNKMKAVKCLTSNYDYTIKAAKEIIDDLPRMIETNEPSLLYNEFEFIDITPEEKTYYVEVGELCVCPKCKKLRQDCNCEEKSFVCYVCHSVKGVIDSINVLIERGYDEGYIEIKTQFSAPWAFVPTNIPAGD